MSGCFIFLGYAVSSKKKERSNSTSKQSGSSSGNGKGKHMGEAEKKYRAYTKSAVTCPGLSDAMQELFRHKEPLIGKESSVYKCQVASVALWTTFSCCFHSAWQL